MIRFGLKYNDPQIEREYISFQRITDKENIQSSILLFVVLLVVPGIPSLINHIYYELGVTISVAVFVFAIHFCKAIPRNYVQFIIAIVVCTYHDFLVFFRKGGLDSLSKSTLFLRGYGFASINLALLTRLSSLQQKLLLIVYELALRLTIILYLDASNAEIYPIIRNCLTDVFVIYTHFFHEKRTRSVFRKFYEYREELIKFKELLSDYFPQSIAVFSNSLKKSLFLNQAFTSIFKHLKDESSFDNSQSIHIQNESRSVFPNASKIDLRSLQVDKNTIREVGATPCKLKWADTSSHCFFEVTLKLISEKILDLKPVCFSASYSLNDEENRIFDVVLTKIKWDGEDATVVMLNDMTIQEKLISLKIANTNKDQVIATVSHELRTPLNGIIGILGIVEKSINDHKIAEYLELCKDNAHLLLGLVNSILDLHQVRQGKLKLNPVKINIRQVVSEVAKLFTFQANNKGIYLKLNFADAIPDYIVTDENRLKQILINLIGNAMKFTLEGGITVEINQDSFDSHSLRISVEDTGIGIKDEDKDKLFQMYEKIEHGRSINKNGVGLGLTISNSLAGFLSGKARERTIEVNSSVGKGSRFSFTLLKDLSGQQLEGKQERISRYLENSEMIEIENNGVSEEISKDCSFNSPFQQYLPTKLEGYKFATHESFQTLLFRKNSSMPKEFSMLSAINQMKNNFESPIYYREDKPNIKDTILVVDDNAFNLLVVENLIKDIGYSFHGTKSGLEAIDIIKSFSKKPNPFKAILMDCQMPIMDGFETTRILRGMMDKGEVPNIPIIALTANNGEEDIQQCYASGMVAHLLKPLFSDILLQTLERLNMSN